MDILTWLQEWYYLHCDEDWEHEERIKITTLDNPGWHIKINLKETELETKNLMRL
ncbi:Imm53 family immunity protein [Paenibacillus polymyxa]|nr:Imm53 family immunity protein [Paenibacillus polymyxa]WDZ59746.1 Imm53 family immunity protein [Paenibacillus polymyxa]